ncbi:MAG: putative polysaccharide biosynthesis protein [Cellulosilyticaceae bacterium]
MGKKALITGTIALTITGFITRILGFLFRIYMSNIMGAEGLGLYQLVFPIYMLIWAASSAGISLAVSRKVAEFTARGKHADAVRTLKSAIVLAVSISFVLSGLIFVFAPWVAEYYVHEPNTALGLKYLCICVPFMATACCIRGYFQGRQEMSISGIAQVVEQLARMVVIYIFAGFYIPRGLAYACALGTLGLCAGELMSCIFTFIMFKIKQRKLKPTMPTLSYGTLMSTLIAISIPITANRFLTSGLSSIENILIPIQLQKYGLSSSESLAMYGMFSGMALPLLFFPSMVTTSISTVLVPALSEASTKKNTYQLHKTVSKSIQYASLIGIGACGLFLTLGQEIALVCYGADDALVGEMLKVLAIICPFFYLQGILTGMLNGLGLQKLTFKGNIMASILCIGAILILVPRQGIMGFILALLIQSGFVTIYHLLHVLKHISLRVDVVGWMLKPTLAAIVGCLFMKYLHTHYLMQMFSLTVSTIIAVGVLGVFYLTFLFLFRSLTREDIQMFLH